MVNKIFDYSVIIVSFIFGVFMFVACAFSIEYGVNANDYKEKLMLFGFAYLFFMRGIIELDGGLNRINNQKI